MASYCLISSQVKGTKCDRFGRTPKNRTTQWYASDSHSARSLRSMSQQSCKKAYLQTLFAETPAFDTFHDNSAATPDRLLMLRRMVNAAQVHSPPLISPNALPPYRSITQSKLAQLKGGLHTFGITPSVACE